ncbi:MAG: ATP-grasp domain-containing protein [Campylobacteraceae bacterium]|nr:ATP-grasp domain-containing protein [Campylobacteraceae bacterium]
MSKSILITSVGSKLALIKAVIRAKDSFDSTLKIVGADSNPNALARSVVDIFWQMPKLENLSFEILLKYVKKYKILYIIPTRDADLPFFARYKKRLEQIGVAVFVASEEAVRFCYDKLHFYETDKDKWAIKTSPDINQIQDSSLVVKERFGAGAKSMACGVSKSEAIAHAKKLKESIFQPFIKGREYSIDCYVDSSMACRGVVVRSRDVVIDGESKVTTIAHDDLLAQKASWFVTFHKIQGHSVLQVIKNEKGSFLIECNARFGGASTLSEYAGLKSFLWFLKEANKEPFSVSITKKIIKQIRKDEDVYIES